MAEIYPKLKSPEEEAVRVWTRMCALVKTELDERRHTVTWLGQQAGISHSSVLRAVGQKRPDPPEKFLTVIRCAHALGMRFTIDGEVVE